MQTFLLFATIIVAVVLMVLAISKLKMHPFIVMLLIAMAVGLFWGIVDPDSGLTPIEVVNQIKSGFGSIMTSIGIVILCGTIIGTILEKTGAALTMANAILKLVGEKNSVVAMGAMGYVTGIPVFCDSGFVVLSPISRALAQQSNISLAVMGTALSGGLYATHCLVPPTPGPIAMAGTLDADLGLTILVGLIVSIPGVLVAILYAKKVASKIDIPANSEYTLDELRAKYGKLPGKVSDEVRAKAGIKPEDVITCRPADLLEPEVAKMKAEAAKWAIQEEDALTYAMFPQVAPKFFEKRALKLAGVDPDHADFAAKTTIV